MLPLGLAWISTGTDPRWGFSFVEIISPCPIYYARFNKLGESIDELKRYRDSTEVKNGAPLEEAALTMTGKIVVGKFIEKQAPTLYEQVMGVGEKARKKRG